MDNLDKEQLKETFPSNAKGVKKEPRQNKPIENKKLNKVVTGSVKKQKRSLGRKLSDTFLEDDTRSVGSYILYDVLIPAAKDLISDIVSGGIEMLLFGDRRSRSSSKRDVGRSHTSYGAYYTRDKDRDRDRRRDISRTARSRHDFHEIILETRGEAEEVLSHLADLIAEYRQATVADLYDLVGIDSNFTDHKYGWTDIRNSDVSRLRGGGYLINLPRTELLD